MEAPLELEAPALDLLKLAHQVKRVHYDAVADHAAAAVVQNAGRHEVQHVLLVADDDGVPRVRPALEPHDDVRFLGKEVYYLALALIAPLGANQYSVHDFVLYHKRPAQTEPKSSVAK